MQNSESQIQRDNLIRQYLPFAKKMARTFYLQRKHLPIEKCDYEASAMLGLCNAASRFNQDYGVEFKNFSYYRIYGEMCDSLRKSGWNLVKDKEAVEIQNVVEDRDRLKIKSKEQELSNVCHYAEELGFHLHYLGRDEGEYKAELSYAHESSPEDMSVSRDSKKFLREMITLLPEREQRVIQFYYFDGLTFEEMRKYFKNATKSWLCKLHKKAIKMLQEQIIKSRLKEEAKELLSVQLSY